MDFVNYLVVGSGPSGVAAARKLQGKGVCIVDVGVQAESDFSYDSFRDSLSVGDLSALLGSRWEFLGNLVTPNRLHSKLRSPGVSYVASGNRFNVRDSSGEVVNQGAGSHALGGMSNAWGAQLLRYTDNDLASVGGWPITAADLNPYYAELEQHIGIAGKADDMHGFLGECERLLPPVPIVSAASELLDRYNRKRHKLGVKLGRARLAVLTEGYRGYESHKFGESEFFSTEQRGIYTARRTLNEMLESGLVNYKSGLEVVGYHENEGFVEVSLRDRGRGGELRTVRARHVLLGCGTVQTARLILLNNGAVGRKLPFLDHPPTLFPLFIPSKFGMPLPSSSYPIQLTATLDQGGARDMISIYYPGALLWSDLLGDMPIPMGSALRLLPKLLGGMLVGQVWEPSKGSPNNRIYLTKSGSIQVDYPDREPYERLKSVLREFRLLGAYSHPRLAQIAPPGWGFHYAGCTPMRVHPREFETHTDGRLWNSKRVRVIDGSVLPTLPAKNHSLTLMANAARIAQEVLICGY